MCIRDRARTAQQTIPYLAMYPDGICKVTEKKYSKSIAFENINYQLAQADDKTAIFENWCDFLNYFDTSVNVQLSFSKRPKLSLILIWSLNRIKRITSQRYSGARILNRYTFSESCLIGKK